MFTLTSPQLFLWDVILKNVVYLCQVILCVYIHTDAGKLTVSVTDVTYSFYHLNKTYIAEHSTQLRCGFTGSRGVIHPPNDKIPRRENLG